ncbi:hypothetical protein [Eisenibacter elegans]|uniref:hypothetical protein n=1 Tax=Eisenibacter elegans TaxID=997 RepID=UPI0012B5F169|nr:hypothetical protein [Eisenibacter elegans]
MCQLDLNAQAHLFWLSFVIVVMAWDFYLVLVPKEDRFDYFKYTLSPSSIDLPLSNYFLVGQAGRQLSKHPLALGVALLFFFGLILVCAYVCGA